MSKQATNSDKLTAELVVALNQAAAQVERLGRVYTSALLEMVAEAIRQDKSVELCEYVNEWALQHLERSK